MSFPMYYRKLGSYRYRRKSVIKDSVERRRVQRLLRAIQLSQRYFVIVGDWRRVVDLDIKVHRLRSLLYGDGYCGW